MRINYTRAIKKIGKYILYIFGILILILLLIWLFIQTPYGQNKALPIALNYLSNTIGTEIKAGHIDISFFDEIQLEDVVALDSEGDTLIYIQKLDGDIGLFSFMNKDLRINNLDLKGAQINLKEVSKGTFNYNHIVSHLTTTSDKKDSTDSSPWNILLDGLELEDSHLKYSSLGNDINVTVPKLKGDLKDFSLEELIFHFNTLSTDGIVFSYEQTDFAHIVEDNKPKSLPTLPFTLIIDDVSIKSDGISYNTNDPLVASPRFDPNHITLEKLAIKAQNFYWKDSIKIDLNRLNVLTTDGFEIKKPIHSIWFIK